MPGVLCSVKVEPSRPQPRKRPFRATTARNSPCCAETRAGRASAPARLPCAACTPRVSPRAQREIVFHCVLYDQRLANEWQLASDRLPGREGGTVFLALGAPLARPHISTGGRTASAGPGWVGDAERRRDSNSLSRSASGARRDGSHAASVWAVLGPRTTVRGALLGRAARSEALPPLRISPRRVCQNIRRDGNVLFWRQ